jgi:hypothetical protein
VWCQVQAGRSALMAADVAAAGDAVRAASLQHDVVCECVGVGIWGADGVSVGCQEACWAP